MSPRRHSPSITVRVPRPLTTAAKHAADAQGVTLSEWLRAAIRHYLAATR